MYTIGGDSMGTKPQKLASNAAHLAKLDRIVVQPYADEGQAIRAAAAAAGQSLQGYILQAVRERMEREVR